MDRRDFQWLMLAIAALPLFTFFIWTEITQQKTDGLLRNRSASRVFPVDDSALVESSSVCLAKRTDKAIMINGIRDLYHSEQLRE